VGYTPREPADRLHSVRLAQPLFRDPPVGHIGAHAGEVGRLAGVVESDLALIGNPAYPPVREHDAEGVVQGASVEERALHCFGHKGAIVRMDPGQKLLVGGHRLARSQSIQLPKVLVPGERVRAHRPEPGSHPGGVERPV